MKLSLCKIAPIGTHKVPTHFLPRRLACDMRACVCHCYYHRSVFLFLFSPSVFCFWPTLGNLLCAKICSPQYFGITRRYMHGNFFFTKKKKIFERFFDFLRPAFGHGRLGHPQSLEYSSSFLLGLYLCCMESVWKYFSGVRTKNIILQCSIQHWSGCFDTLFCN